jgi:hypothetical protein
MGEPAAPRPPGVPTTVTCPGCGVAVAVGYPRCPRCQAAVPRGRPPTLQGGGTSLAGERSEWPRWALAGAALTLVFGAVLWLATRESPARATDAGALADAEAFEEEDAEEEEEGEVALAPAPGAEPVEAATALRQLDEALRSERLWAKLRVAGALIEIESALCDDAAMWPAIAGVAEALHASGARAVRCLAPHGAVVFERDL